MSTERVLRSETIFQGRAVSLILNSIELPSGRHTTREIVKHSECVAVVPLDQDNNVLLVRQFRDAVGRDLLEIPAGGIDEGETPEECVRRELREEIGYLPRTIKKMGGFYSAPGYSTEYLHLFLATDLEPSPLQAEDTESIQVVRVPLAQIPALIASGEISDAKSIAGLLRVIAEADLPQPLRYLDFPSS